MGMALRPEQYSFDLFLDLNYFCTIPTDLPVTRFFSIFYLVFAATAGKKVKIGINGEFVSIFSC